MLLCAISPRPRLNTMAPATRRFPKMPCSFANTSSATLRMHIENDRVEEHTFALGYRPSDRAGPLADLEIFIEPVFGVPDGNLFVLRRIRVWVLHVVLQSSCSLTRRGALSSVTLI